MPLVPGETEAFNDAYEQTYRSVVGLIVDGNQVVGAGCVVHVSPDLTVVSVPSSFRKEHGASSIIVSFFNGTRVGSSDLVFLSDGDMDLLFVGVEAGGWTEATFGELGEAESEVVFTIVPSVIGYKQNQRIFLSHIISPRCTSVSRGGQPLPKTREQFTFTLPLGMNSNPGSRLKWIPVEKFVLGAPVFNMNNEWVGFPVQRSVFSVAMKLGMRVQVFQQQLNAWLAGRCWEVAIQRYVQRNAEIAEVIDWY